MIAIAIIECRKANNYKLRNPYTVGDMLAKY